MKPKLPDFNDPVIKQRTREIQILLLQKILDVCKKNSLKIWIDSGTLLGAVRHKGFIPWDDDIDVAMFREDYDKLISIAQKEFTTPYFFQCFFTDNGYYRGHAQLRYDDTSMILKYDLKYGRKFHQGIFLDIFVLDSIPTTNKELDRLVNITHRINTYLWRRKYFFFKPDFIRLIKDCIILKTKIFWSDKKLYTYFEDLFRQTKAENSDKVSFLSLFHPSHRSLRNKSWYNETDYLYFEGIKVPVPAEYDKLLTFLYGDYMTPRQDTTMHGDTIIDPFKGYKYYLKS